MDRINTMHSVGTGFIHAILSCYLPINTKYSVLILYDRGVKMWSCTRAAQPKTRSARTFFLRFILYTYGCRMANLYVCPTNNLCAVL